MGNPKGKISKAQSAFNWALKHYYEEKGYGFQTWLAEKVGVSTRHINDLVHNKKGASIELMEAIADALETTVEDMLALGRKLSEPLPEPKPSPPPPSSEAEEKGFPVHTLKRAKFFWQKAHEVVFQGEEVTMIPFEGLIEGQDLLEAYVRQELTDEEVWERMVKILEEWKEKLERDVKSLEEG